MLTHTHVSAQRLHVKAELPFSRRGLGDLRAAQLEGCPRRRGASLLGAAAAADEATYFCLFVCFGLELDVFGLRVIFNLGGSQCIILFNLVI